MKDGARNRDAGLLFAAIALFGMIVGVGCAGAASAQTDPAAPPSGGPVEIPFQLFNGNLVVARATIGKLRDVKVIIDTGTNPSAISLELAKRLNLPGKTESL